MHERRHFRRGDRPQAGVSIIFQMAWPEGGTACLSPRCQGDDSYGIDEADQRKGSVGFPGAGGGDRAVCCPTGRSFPGRVPRRHLLLHRLHSPGQPLPDLRRAEEDLCRGIRFHRPGRCPDFPGCPPVPCCGDRVHRVVDPCRAVRSVCPVRGIVSVRGPRVDVRLGGTAGGVLPPAVSVLHDPHPGRNPDPDHPVPSGRFRRGGLLDDPSQWVCRCSGTVFCSRCRA